MRRIALSCSLGFAGAFRRSELGRKNDWSPAEIDQNLTKAYGDNKAQLEAEFRNAFPRKKVQDVLYFANGYRPTVKQTLAWKLEKSKTPVWNYLFAWEYPVNGGITSFHCAEIAFAFHNVSEPHIRLATGGGPVAMALICATWMERSCWRASRWAIMY